MPQRFLLALLLLFSLAAGAHTRGADTPGKHADLTVATMESLLEKMTAQIPENISRLEERQKEYIHSVQKMENRLHELTVAVYFQNFSNLFFITYYCNQIANLRTEFFSSNFPFVSTRKALEIELGRFDKLKASLISLKEHGNVSEAEQATLERCIANCTLLTSTYRHFHDKLLLARERYTRLGQAIQALDIYANGREVDLYASFNTAVSTTPTAATSVPPDSQKPVANVAPSAPQAAATPGTEQATPASAHRAQAREGLPVYAAPPANEEGALLQSIAVVLRTPTHPFRHSGVSTHPLETIGQVFMRSVRDNYLEPGDREMVQGLKELFVQVVASVAVLLILAKTAAFLVGRRLAPRKRSYPRLSVVAAAVVCLLEAAWLYGYSNFIAKEFLRIDVVIIAQFLVICAVVIFSLAVRLSAARVRQGLYLFLPTFLLSGAMLLYDLAKATTFLVAFTVPFLYIAAIGAMLFMLLKRSRGLSVGLKTHAIVSLIIAVGGLIASLRGYAYLMMLGQLVWFIVLSGVLVLGTISMKLEQWKQSPRSNKMHHIWLQLFLAQFVVPMLGIACLWYALIWPAEAFDLSYLIQSWMHRTHVVSGVMSALSIDNALLIVTIGIALNCFINIVRQTVHSIYGSEFESGRIPTFFTLGTMVAWGGFAVISLQILQADYHGILVVMGGMSVGVGFAMKDTIENLICGLSLMLGRMRPGDIVECDGIRGKVASIGYRTTTIETVAGSIIAFQNSQLFNRNFSNMTKNHLYERATVTIGVTYGTDIDFARRLILDAITPLPLLSKKHPVAVVLNEFGDSSVNLCVSVWVPVRTKSVALSSVREAIYKTFNDHGVEIPFPQQDLYIKGDPLAAKQLQVGEASDIPAQASLPSA